MIVKNGDALSKLSNLNRIGEREREREREREKTSASVDVAER